MYFTPFQIWNFSNAHGTYNNTPILRHTEQRVAPRVKNISFESLGCCWPLTRAHQWNASLCPTAVFKLRGYCSPINHKCIQLWPWPLTYKHAAQWPTNLTFDFYGVNQFHSWIVWYWLLQFICIINMHWRFLVGIGMFFLLFGTDHECINLRYTSLTDPYGC